MDRREGWWRAKRPTVDGRLTGQLLEHFRRTGESVTGFADGDVEDEFLDAELSHGVCVLVFARGAGLWLPVRVFVFGWTGRLIGDY